MLNKEDFKQSQPVAFRTLSNALKTGRLSHAYLFSGPKGEIKSEAALLFAQSLYCEHPDEDGLACQNCTACRRVAEEENMDFFWAHPGSLRSDEGFKKKEIDAYWKSAEGEWKPSGSERNFMIRKQTIAALQSAFETAGREKGDHQVYILEQYDKATPTASNALLKFLEEPHEGIIGILIADDLAKVLDTIQSRCQLVPFRAPSRESRKSRFAAILSDADQIEMLTQSGLSVEAVKEAVTDPFFETLQKESRNYLDHFREDGAILHMQTEVLPPKSEQLTKLNAELFLHWLLYWLKKDLQRDPALTLNLRLKVLEVMDRLARPVELALQLDGLYWSMKNV